VSNEVNIIVKVDTLDAQGEIADFQNQIDKLATRWQRIKNTIKTESSRLMYSLMGIINLAKHVMEAFGVSIGPIGDALLAIISSVIQSAIAMQYAYAAGGPVGWAMMAISAAALGVAIGAQIRAAQGVDEAKANAAKTQAILSDLGSILGPWRTF